MRPQPDPRRRQRRGDSFCRWRASACSAPGKPDVPARYIDDAARLGAAIASRGHTLIYGGGGTGMMGALAEAAAAGGAHVVGVAPQSVVDRGSSSSIGELVVTSDLGARKAHMLDRCDLVIVMPGGMGTLDELFEVWTLGPQLRVHEFPVVLVNSHGFYDGLLAWLASRVEDGMMHATLIDAIRVVPSIEDIFDELGKGSPVARVSQNSFSTT